MFLWRVYVEICIFNMATGSHLGFRPLAAIRSRFGKPSVWFLNVDGPVTQIKFQNLLRMSRIRGPGRGQDYKAL